MPGILIKRALMKAVLMHSFGDQRSFDWGTRPSRNAKPMRFLSGFTQQAATRRQRLCHKFPAI